MHISYCYVPVLFETGTVELTSILGYANVPIIQFRGKSKVWNPLKLQIYLTII